MNSQKTASLMDMDELMDFDTKNHRSSVKAFPNKEKDKPKAKMSLEDHHKDFRGSMLMNSKRPSEIKLESFQLIS